MSTEEKSKILAEFKLFKGLNKSQLLELSKVADERVFNTKDVLMEEGEEGEDVYFIYEGSFKVYRISPDGKEVGLAINGKGDIAGEMALFDHGIRSAFVEAIEECKTLKLKRRDFENVLKTSPEMAIELLRVMSHRVVENSENIEALSTKTLKDRVHAVIKTLSHYMPKIDISQEEIASMVGATRPRVSEVLTELKQEGLIEIKDREIVLQRTD